MILNSIHITITISITNSFAHFRWSTVTDRLISQKTNYSSFHQDLGLIKIQFWWSHVPSFLWCCGQACYYYLLTKLKPWFSTKDRRVESVDQCIWTQAPWTGWHKWPCIVHGQSALCFFSEGSIAEPKVSSWYEATLWQLFQDWLSVMWTSTSPVLFTTTDFVFCKSFVLLFLHHHDTASY